MKINLIIFLSRFGLGGAGNSIFPPSIINSFQSNKKIYKKNRTLIISTACRLTREKGLDVLFQALSLLKLKILNY